MVHQNEEGEYSQASSGTLYPPLDICSNLHQWCAVSAIGSNHLQRCIPSKLPLESEFPMLHIWVVLWSTLVSHKNNEVTIQMLGKPLIRTSLNTSTLSTRHCSLWNKVLKCTCRHSEAISPTSAPMSMRYGSTGGAICGSQLGMDREVSAPHLARPSTQVMAPAWRWDNQAVYLLRSL